jgi:cytochrome b subunit of formate dehydrogenase
LKKSLVFYLIKTHIIAVSFLLLFSAAASAEFVDAEGCLLCHRYPTLGRYDDKTGEKKVFYVNEESYSGSDHGVLRCTNCHVELNRLPHDDPKKVDCSIRCHLLDKSTKQEFSHSIMVQKYELSVHGGGKSEKTERFPEDFPDCQHCHDNQLSGMFDSSGSRTLSEESGISHVWERRTQKKIIELCAGCHSDSKMASRHGIDTIDTFKDTFHWEMIKYGVGNAPDCISCHVPQGYSSHDIRPHSDPFSSIHVNNRVKTCSGEGGMVTCHPDATPDFSEGKVHAYSMKAQLSTKESVMDAGQRFKALMFKRSKQGLAKDEILSYYIIEILKLFYKLLIGGVIGFMSLHQLLEYIRARKKHKGKEHRHITDSRVTIGSEDESGGISFIRLNLSERVQHMIFLISFIVLVITGFMVKIPEEVVIVLGSAGEKVFFIRKVLHRVAGVAMILISIYHVYYIFFKAPGRRWIKDINVRLGDFKGMYNNILYFVGRREEPPEFDRFCYKHKIEYFALIAGTILMSVTGVMLWTEFQWDKLFLDIAAIVHGMEAILASLAIIVWHLYEVHLRPRKFPVGDLWITGVIDEEEMKEEYPLHYKKIMDDPALRNIYMKERSLKDESSSSLPVEKRGGLLRRSLIVLTKAVYVTPVVIFAIWLLQIAYFPHWVYVPEYFSMHPKVSATVTELTGKEEMINKIEQHSDPIPRGHFHNTDKYIERLIHQLDTDPALCLKCHGTYPHKKEKSTRSMLNMHNGFMACEVCHVKNKDYSFVWADIETGKESTRPEGSHGKYAATIVPVKTVNGRAVRLDKVVRNSFALEYLELNNTYTEGQLNEVMKVHERNLSKDPVSCLECHMKDGYMDYGRLGFSVDRASELTSSAIPRVMLKEDSFIFPNLFGH